MHCILGSWLQSKPYTSCSSWLTCKLTARLSLLSVIRNTAGASRLSLARCCVQPAAVLQREMCMHSRGKVWRPVLFNCLQLPVQKAYGLCNNSSTTVMRIAVGHRLTRCAIMHGGAAEEVLQPRMPFEAPHSTACGHL